MCLILLCIGLQSQKCCTGEHTLFLTFLRPPSTDTLTFSDACRFLSFTNMLRPTQSFTGLPRWGSGLHRSSLSKGSLTFLGRRSKSVHGGTPGPPPSVSESPNLEMTPQMHGQMSPQQGHVEASHGSLSRLRHSSAPGNTPSFTLAQSSPSLGSNQRMRSPFDPCSNLNELPGHAGMQLDAPKSFSGSLPLPHRGRSDGSGAMAGGQLMTIHSVGSSGLGTLETAGSARSLLPAGPSSSAQGLAISRHGSENSRAESSGASFSSSEAGPEIQAAAAAQGKPLSRLAHGSS